MPISIAIDGYSGTGKSTLAKQLSEKLGFVYLDTGALYRAVTVKILENMGKNYDAGAIDSLLKSTKIRVEQSPDGNQIFLDNKNITARIREPEISDMVSKVAAEPVVRSFLIKIQRKNANKQNVVLEGRDIGTVVLPKAKFKIFLIANIEERAERRWKELKDGGIDLSLDEVKKNLEERDNRDTSRKNSPLKKAHNAFIIDSSKTTPEEKLNIALGFVRNKLLNEKQLFHKFYKFATLLILKFFCRITYHYENKGALKHFAGIVISNHCSNLDPPIVGNAFDSHLHYFGKSSLLENIFLKYFLAPCNIIPVDRSNVSPKSIRTVLRFLEERKSILIFPEGTRSTDGEIKTGKTGAGMIAKRAKKPILPVYVSGSYKVLPKGAHFPKFSKVSVYVGTPYELDGTMDNSRQVYDDISNQMIEKIKSLRDMPQ